MTFPGSAGVSEVSKRVVICFEKMTQFRKGRRLCADARDFWAHATQA